MAKYLIFDLDGTVLDTLDDLHDAVNHTMREFGYPENTRLQTRSYVGNGMRNLMRQTLPEGTSDDTLDTVLAAFQPWYAAHSNEKTKPYDGIPELLRELRAAGKCLLMVSNKPNHAVGPLMAHHFPGLFDAAYGERAGIARKPDPEAIHAVMAEFGAEPEDTVYIGDSEVDVRTAKNAGIGCVCVDWGFRDREVLVAAGADVIASTVEELRELLL